MLSRLQVMEGLVIQLVNAQMDNPELGPKEYELAFNALRLMVANDPRYKPGLCLADYLGEDQPSNIADSKSFERAIINQLCGGEPLTELPDDALICLLDENDQEFRWFGRYSYSEHKRASYIEIPNAVCSYWTKGFGVIIPRISEHEILLMMRFENGFEKAFIMPTDQPRIRVPILVTAHKF